MVNMKCFFLMIICSLCLCFAQFVWKIMPDYNLIYLFAGFTIYASGSFAMLLAYRNGELSVLQPLISTSYVFSAILGIIFLHEKMSSINLIGLILIIAGVIVIGRGRR